MVPKARDVSDRGGPLIQRFPGGLHRCWVDERAREGDRRWPPCDGPNVGHGR